MRFEIRIHASRIEQPFHFFRHDRAVVAEDFDPLKRKMPARIRRRRECAVEPVFEFKDQRELIELGIFVLRSVCDELFDLAKLKPHHVEKVDRSLVKKSAGDIHVAGPDRIHELAAIHLNVRRVGFVALEQMLELNIPARTGDYARPGKHNRSYWQRREAR